MRRSIMKDEAFLGRASAPATEDDLPVGDDLRDTLAAHEHECVGMAANMIGVSRRVIVFADGLTGRSMVMFNPEIVAKAEPYETREGCLSLEGERPATRYRRITVTYRDRRWRERAARFEGFTAQIIQHEIDHCNGILI